jgi:hypothetical protein
MNWISSTSTWRRAGATAALTAALALALPAIASARTTFYVDESSGDDANLCNLAEPCRTISSAVSKARGASYPGGDDIRVAPGTYDEHVILGSQDDGVVIDGAGVPTLGHAGTVIRIDDTSFAGVVHVGGDDITVRDLVVVAPSPPPSPMGIYVTGARFLLESAAVRMLDSESVGSGIALSSDAEDAALEHVRVSGTWDGDGVISAAPGLLIEDSWIDGGDSMLGGALDLRAGTTTVRRSRLEQDYPDAFSTVFLDPNDAPGQVGLVAESTLITGGTRGVDVHTGEGTSASLALRHVTIDAATPGEAGNGPSVRANADAGTIDVDVESSLLMEGVHETYGDGSVTLRCRYTHLAPSPCEGEGQVTSDALAWGFADLAGGDYRLAPGSTAVDSGAPAGLAVGESLEDLAHAQRVVDGDGDCGARTDRGAYELQAPPVDPSGCPGPVSDPPAPDPAPDPPVPGPASNPPSDGAPVDRVAPLLSRVRATPGRAGRGIRVSFSLSEPARMTIVLQRKRRPRAGRRARWARFHVLRGDGQPGRNSISSRLSGRRLAAGSYRARILAMDAAGNRSRRRVVSFQVQPKEDR